MANFISLVRNILEDQCKTVSDLFNDRVISPNTFYKYSARYPSLKTCIKILNYLKVSADYLFERTETNRFTEYSNDQSKFSDKLIALIKRKGISFRKFCKDLNYSKDNIIRYRNGVEPSVRTLLEIADYLDCFIDDLLILSK